MTDSTMKVRPVWVTQGSTREDTTCTHRVAVHGSSIRFIRCGRNKDGEIHGYPVCRSHRNKLEEAA